MVYKIDLVQVRKMTVYCHDADNEEEADKWFNEHKKVIFNHLNMEDYEYNRDVHCYTVWGIIEDNSTERLYNLLHGEQLEEEKQMEAVYKVLKQETKEDSDNGTPN